MLCEWLAQPWLPSPSSQSTFSDFEIWLCSVVHHPPKIVVLQKSREEERNRKRFGSWDVTVSEHFRTYMYKADCECVCVCVWRREVVWRAGTDRKSWETIATCTSPFSRRMDGGDFISLKRVSPTTERGDINLHSDTDLPMWPWNAQRSVNDLFQPFSFTMKEATKQEGTARPLPHLLRSSSPCKYIHT